MKLVVFSVINLDMSKLNIWGFLVIVTLVLYQTVLLITRVCRKDVCFVMKATTQERIFPLVLNALLILV